MLRTTPYDWRRNTASALDKRRAVRTSGEKSGLVNLVSHARHYRPVPGRAQASERRGGTSNGPESVTLQLAQRPYRQDAKSAKGVLASAAKLFLGDGRCERVESASRLPGGGSALRPFTVTSNRYVNETENQTLTTPRQRPEDAKDAAVGRVSLLRSAGACAACCLSDVHPPAAVLGVLGVLAVNAVAGRERLQFPIPKNSQFPIPKSIPNSQSRKPPQLPIPKSTPPALGMHIGRNIIRGSAYAT